jgi:hypothetical protein
MKATNRPPLWDMLKRVWEVAHDFETALEREGDAMWLRGISPSGRDQLDVLLTERLMLRAMIACDHAGDDSEAHLRTVMGYLGTFIETASLGAGDAVREHLKAGWDAAHTAPYVFVEGAGMYTFTITPATMTLGVEMTWPVRAVVSA